MEQSRQIYSKLRKSSFKEGILKFTRPSPKNTHICFNTKGIKNLARSCLNLIHFHLIKYAVALYIMEKTVSIYSLFNLPLLPQFHK